jgi:hypothetical protein
MRISALVVALCTVASGYVTARGKTEFYTFVDTVVFRDAPGDGVHSETPGLTSTYTNGVGGAVIRIVYGGSGDLTLDLNATRPQRTMMAETTPSNLLAVLGSPYATTATPCSFLNVNDVWGVAIGQTINRSAIYTHATGRLNFGQYGASSSDATSTQVWVTRTSKTFWVVTTDSTDGKALYSTSSKGRTGGGNTAEYALPFQLTITCSKCATLN